MRFELLLEAMLLVAFIEKGAHGRREYQVVILPPLRREQFPCLDPKPLLVQRLDYLRAECQFVLTQFSI